MKNTIFLLLCFATSHIMLFAQSTQQIKLDSLRKVLPSLKDSARVDCLNELAIQHYSSYPHTEEGIAKREDSLYHYAVLANKEAIKIGYLYGEAMSLLYMSDYGKYRKKDPDATEKLINSAILIGEKIKNNKVLGWAYTRKFSIYYLGKQGKMEALNQYKKALGYFQSAGEKEEELKVTVELCGMYNQMGKYEEGFEYCSSCMELVKTITPVKNGTYMYHLRRILSYFNMAELYKAVGDYHTAIDYYKQSDHYVTKNKQGWYMYINLSEMFCKLGQYDSALFYWNRWKKDHDASQWIRNYGVINLAAGNLKLGLIYLKTKRYDEALKIFEESIRVLKNEIKDAPYMKPRLSQSLLLAAQANVEKKNWNAALKYATEGIDLARKEKIRTEVMEGHELLSEIYHAQGKEGQAYANLLQYTVLKDSIINRQFLWRLSSYKKEAEAKKKKAEVELLNKENQIKDEQLKQENLIRNFLLAALIGLAFISILVFRTFRLKRKNDALKHAQLEDDLKLKLLESQKHEIELRQQASELEMQALRAQMNPHFIFNCLSSINRFILKNESDTASDYLTRFSRLIRLVLINSKRPLVFLEDELEMLRLYIEMERLRFKNSFDFNIIFKNEIDTTSIPIPPLLLQPFVENAIWHGLMNKDGHGQLDIAFAYNDDSLLTCTITDNGVGRIRAAELKSNKDVKGKSLGLQITAERLSKLNKENSQDTFFTVRDLYDSEGKAAGTEVLLAIRLEESMREVVAMQDILV